jgi:hypothetical protein
MRRLLMTIALGLAALPAASAEPPAGRDVAAWAAELGGSTTRDDAGRVVAVDLRASWVNDLGLQKLLAEPSIRRLDLSRTHITDAGLETVAKLPNLVSLDLRFCEHITEAGVAHLKDSATLQRLDLRGTAVSDSGIAFLAQVGTLRALDIGSTQITEPALEALEALENLEELAVGGNRVGDLGLSYLHALPKLRRLDLSGSQVTDSGVWGVTVTDGNLDAIALLIGLEELNLAASDAEYVSSIGDGVPRVRNRIEITDLGAGKLTALTRLRSLDLSRSAVTAKGLEALAKLPALEVLTLSHATGLGDEAVPALLAMKTLRTLDLTGVALSDAALELLAGHPALEKLIALDTGVSEAGAAALARLKPDCALIW